ncbi:hypothetical protein C8R44DRAFT_746690 [Mycena epipterygia]|nr:hypothetical protein C8R44DRAFT_746690 [Mycena epipterygia]
MYREMPGMPRFDGVEEGWIISKKFEEEPLLSDSKPRKGGTISSIRLNSLVTRRDEARTTFRSFDLANQQQRDSDAFEEVEAIQRLGNELRARLPNLGSRCLALCISPPACERSERLPYNGGNETTCFRRQEYLEGDGPVRMAPPSFLARTFEDNIFARGQYKILKDIVAPVPAVATMDASDFALNQSIDLQWSPIETACSELSRRDRGQSLVLRGSMRSLASTKDLHGHPGTRHRRETATERGNHQEHMSALENDNWRATPRDAKLDISQIKRLLTERYATFFNEDIVVYVPEKARTGQAAKEYFWKDGEVESRIKEQIREASTSDTRHHYQGIIIKVSLPRCQRFKCSHIYISTYIHDKSAD